MISPWTVRVGSCSPSGPRANRIGLLVRLTHELGQAPVEDDDLAEVAEDDVVALEVAVQDAARMGVGNGVADGDERGQQAHEVQRLGLPLGPFGMVGVDGAGERAAADEPHRVERLVGVCPGSQLVDRHDPGVLELPGQPGFAEKARRDLGVAGLFREQLLEGHFPVQMAVPRQPNPANPTGGVEAQEGVTRLQRLDRRSAYSAARSRAGRPNRQPCRRSRVLREPPGTAS